MHHSRLCAVLIDCRTSELDGAARLAKLGAKVAERLERWVVMEAPTGQRFCVVRIQRPGFPKNANRWE
ncbi:MAG: VOC family protein [Steroidobacteraceae bacterium]